MIRLNKVKNHKELRRFLGSIIGEIHADVYSRDIFIKPNLGGRYPTLKSENTDVSFLQILCEILLNEECKTITIGHSSLHGHEYDSKYHFNEIINASGYTKLRNLKNVTLANLDSAIRYKEKIEEIVFEIPVLLKNAYYINLSKLKTHMETKVSLSLKNQMGLVSMDNKKQMHRLGLHNYIACLGKLLKPHLNIIDGIIAMEGNGPHHGRDKMVGIIICGDDMVEVDSLACKLIGIKYEDVEHIKTAYDMGAGKYVSGEIVDKYNEIKFRIPSEYIRKGLSFYVWPTTACSGCLFSLSKAVNELTRQDIFKMLKICFMRETNVIMGRGDHILNKKADNMRNIIAIGNCTKKIIEVFKVKECALGCPPSIEDIKRILRSR